MTFLSRLTILKPAARWLAKTVGKIVSIARYVSKGKGRGSTFAVTKITSFIKSSTRAVIAAVGPFVHRRAFDHEFRVPMGGFKPKSAKAFPMQKPEGLIFRSRTYSRFGGQVIRKRGFFNKALEKTVAALRG